MTGEVTDRFNEITLFGMALFWQKAVELFIEFIIHFLTYRVERLFKGQLQRVYKFVSYERAVKILKNDICITEIGQAVLGIFQFKVEFPRKIPKIRNFANVSIIRVEQ